MYSRQGALCLFLVAVASAHPAHLFDHLQWRMIGPFRGGRAVAVAGVPGDPATSYFGSVGGGVRHSAAVIFQVSLPRQRRRTSEATYPSYGCPTGPRSLSSRCPRIRSG